MVSRSQADGLVEVPVGRRVHPAEQTFRIRDRDAFDVFARHLPSPVARPQGRAHALYVHGATFPSGLSVAYPFGGRSWAEEMAAAGIDAWSFDLLGYGHSQRYPQQAAAPDGLPPLGRASAAAAQVERVVGFVRREHGVERVSLVAHSWGSMGACLFAARRPDWVDRLVLFAPIARRQPEKQDSADDLGGLQSPANLGAWYPLTVQAQYDRFVGDLPAGHPPVLTDEIDQWAEAWLDTDPTSRLRSPPSVRTPSGPIADIAAAWSGELPYDPSQVRAPTCIIRGEWDSMCTDADARWLFDSLTQSPMRRDIKISAGTHLMHLECSRYALYREAATFLNDGDTQPRRTHEPT